MIGTVHRTAKRTPRSTILALLALLAADAAAADPAAPWTATDALGRRLPSHEETGPPRAGKTVGIVYHVWHGAHGHDELVYPDDEGQGVRDKPPGPLASPYDLTEILENAPGDPEFGPPGAYHHWGEPELGYYLAGDEHVIRKHIALLADAGVDVLILDVSNGFSYRNNVLRLLDVMAAVRAEGNATPQVAFMAYLDAHLVTREVYEYLHAPGKHRDLWFEWREKPLLLAPPSEVDPEVRDFFAIRETWVSSRGPWFGDGRDRWTWLDETPQRPGWHDDPETPEQISVAVAGQPTTNTGRSFHAGAQPDEDAQRPGEGLHFQEQWDHALEVDPDFVLVTGWNAWLTQLVPSDGSMEMLGEPVPEGEPVFVDAFNEEFNRDIEPVADGSSDNLYHQLTANIRRFKGTRPVPRAGPRQTLSTKANAAAWKTVEPEYIDTTNDSAGRDHPGWGRIERLQQPAAPNDIVSARVARDADTLWFAAFTRDPVEPPTTRPWMLLFIDTEPDAPDEGWHGFQFRVEGNPPAETAFPAEFTRTLSRFDPANGGRWKPVAEVECAVRDNLVEIAVPRDALGLKDRPAQLDFKWADAPSATDHILDLTRGGDTAPNRRFAYPYRAED